ncbi:hypothetical protein BESB_055460 [Besnoitia besnoiti]|uniref:EGF-like domain-containing protein n=1 Tax=Besnoitia besnoiti TaxID=94643 RepID=A0A2A9MD25_BESBE|nr:hypothetical protein BESB_055460 [Besnoitia besnoiti]PFH35895.1 hypothetical protein BESB_055460 [Besnoitia besnoiti]
MFECLRGDGVVCTGRELDRCVCYSRPQPATTELLVEYVVEKVSESLESRSNTFESEALLRRGRAIQNPLSAIGSHGAETLEQHNDETRSSTHKQRDGISHDEDDTAQEGSYAGMLAFLPLRLRISSGPTRDVELDERRLSQESDDAQRDSQSEGRTGCPGPRIYPFIGLNFEANTGDTDHRLSTFQQRPFTFKRTVSGPQGKITKLPPFEIGGSQAEKLAAFIQAKGALQSQTLIPLECLSRGLWMRVAAIRVSTSVATYSPAERRGLGVNSDTLHWLVKHHVEFLHMSADPIWIDVIQSVPSRPLSHEGSEGPRGVRMRHESAVQVSVEAHSCESQPPGSFPQQSKNGHGVHIPLMKASAVDKRGLWHFPMHNVSNAESAVRAAALSPRKRAAWRRCPTKGKRASGNPRLLNLLKAGGSLDQLGQEEAQAFIEAYIEDADVSRARTSSNPVDLLNRSASCFSAPNIGSLASPFSTPVQPQRPATHEDSTRSESGTDARPDPLLGLSAASCAETIAARPASRRLCQRLTAGLPPLHARRPTQARASRELVHGSTLLTWDGRWSYGLAYLGRDDLLPAVVLRTTMLVPRATSVQKKFPRETLLVLQMILRKDALPQWIERAMSRSSDGTPTSGAAASSNRTDYRRASASIEGVSVDAEPALADSPVDGRENEQGLLVFQTPSLKTLSPGQYIVGWRLLQRASDAFHESLSTSETAHGVSKRQGLRDAVQTGAEQRGIINHVSRQQSRENQSRIHAQSSANESLSPRQGRSPFSESDDSSVQSLLEGHQPSYRNSSDDIAKENTGHGSVRRHSPMDDSQTGEPQRAGAHRVATAGAHDNPRSDIQAARGHWEFLCLCPEGFMGDRCEAKTLPDYASSLVMISNVAMVPAIAWAAQIGDIVACFVFLFTAVVSLFYHVCFSELWCILPPHSLYLFDHLGSVASFMCVAVTLMQFSICTHRMNPHRAKGRKGDNYQRSPQSREALHGREQPSECFVASR